MYSHGEIPLQQYGRILEILELRNAVAHGFAAEGVESAAAEMLVIVHELFDRFSPQSAAA
jgi:cytochrome P450